MHTPLHSSAAGTVSISVTHSTHIWNTIHPQPLSPTKDRTHSINKINQEQGHYMEAKGAPPLPTRPTHTTTHVILSLRLVHSRTQPTSQQPAHPRLARLPRPAPRRHGRLAVRHPLRQPVHPPLRVRGRQGLEAQRRVVLPVDVHNEAGRVALGAGARLGLLEGDAVDGGEVEGPLRGPGGGGADLFYFGNK